MNARPSKNHQKIVAPRKRVGRLGGYVPPLTERLSPYVLDLARTKSLPKVSADLAHALLVTTSRRAPGLTDNDALLGAMSAAYLVGLAVGMSRDDFIAWLRISANSLERSTEPASSGSPR